MMLFRFFLITSKKNVIIYPAGNWQNHEMHSVFIILTTKACVPVPVWIDSTARIARVHRAGLAPHPILCFTKRHSVWIIISFSLSDDTVLMENKHSSTCFCMTNILLFFRVSTLYMRHINNIIWGVPVTYIGVGENIAIRVGNDQHVKIHGVQEGSERGVGTVIRGNLSKDERFCRNVEKKTRFHILHI